MLSVWFSMQTFLSGVNNNKTCFYFILTLMLAPKGAQEVEMSVCLSICAAHYAIKSQSHLRTGTLGDEAAACPGPGAASGQTVILAPEAEVILACNTLP